MSQKDVALKCLEKLNIYEPYVRKFQSKQTIPCFFENYAGFYADQEPELWKKIKEVEAEYGCLIYAITHEHLDFGNCWSMLCISNGCTEVEDHLSRSRKANKSFYAYAYVWNQTNEQLSEFGDVVVQVFGGGIKRIG